MNTSREDIQLGGKPRDSFSDADRKDTVNVTSSLISHPKASSNEKVAANNSSGITISTEKAAANLLRVKDTLLDHDRLTEICVGETKKVTNSLNSDLKMKLFDVAEGNNGLVVGVFDITGPNAGRGVPNLEVFGAITKTASKYTLILSAKVAQEIDQFRLSLYGRKRFEAKWNDVVVLFEEVTVKPPPKLRPNASFIFHNASSKDAEQITSQGQLTISSRDDPRSGPGSPVFPDIYLPYDGRTAVQLPRGLPDAMITITPDIRGFSNKRSEKFLLLNCEVNPTELKMNLSATDLSGSEWRVVLTWGQTPRDLDLYCVTNFEPSEIYFNKKNEGGRSNKKKGMIELDVDVQSGFGPETITFTPLADKKYRFYVHNFSNERALSESCANIVIHKGDGETLSFDVPTDIVVDDAGNHARYWNVFELLDGEIRIANKVVAADLRKCKLGGKPRDSFSDADRKDTVNVTCSPISHPEAPSNEKVAANNFSGITISTEKALLSSRASDKAVLEAGPFPRPPQPRQRLGGNYHNTPLPPLPRSELSIAPPLPLVMEEPTCHEPQSQFIGSYQINHSVEVSHERALAAESQPKYSAPPPPPSRTQQQTHNVAPPPPPPGVADNAVLTMDSSIHKRSRRQSGGNPRSSISSKSYDLLEYDESADSAPLMSRRTERKIAEAKVEPNNKPSLPESDDLMLSGIDGPELNQTVPTAPRGRRDPGMRPADLIITNSQAKADSKSNGGSAKQAAADSSKSSQGSETSKVATNHSSHVESFSNEKVAANNFSGITISTEKAAANLLRVKDTLLDHDRLAEICIGETKKVTNSLNSDLKMKLFNVADGNNGLVVGVFDITGPNAGRGVPNLEVFGAFTMSRFSNTYSLILSAKAQEIDQFRLSLYGRKRFEAKWNDVVVLFEEVTVKSPPKLRPSASFIFHNAKNAQQITSQGQLTISSRDDPRSGLGSPVFPDIYLPYDGRTAVQLPRGLPDAMITITPDIRGFSNKRSEKFLLLNGEVNPTELKMILSATDLSGSEWRVVLTWGEAPRDLDLYCVTNFEPSEIYFGEKSRSNKSKGKIELDVDKREGFGPETITFTPLADKNYRFYVHNYSNERALSESCANIVIHKGDGITISFNIPTDIVVDSAGKHARYWNVFDVLDGEIRISNEVVAEKLSGDAWPKGTRYGIRYGGNVSHPASLSNPNTHTVTGIAATLESQFTQPKFLPSLASHEAEEELDASRSSSLLEPQRQQDWNEHNDPPPPPLYYKMNHSVDDSSNNEPLLAESDDLSFAGFKASELIHAATSAATAAVKETLVVQDTVASGNDVNNVKNRTPNSRSSVETILGNDSENIKNSSITDLQRHSFLYEMVNRIDYQKSGKVEVKCERSFFSYYKNYKSRDMVVHSTLLSIYKRKGDITDDARLQFIVDPNRALNDPTLRIRDFLLAPLGNTEITQVGEALLVLVSKRKISKNSDNNEVVTTKQSAVFQQLTLKFQSREEREEWMKAIIAECDKNYLKVLLNSNEFDGFVESVNKEIWSAILLGDEALRKAYVAPIGSDNYELVRIVVTIVIDWIQLLLGPSLVQISPEQKEIFVALFSLMMQDTAARALLILVRPDPAFLMDFQIYTAAGEYLFPGDKANEKTEAEIMDLKMCATALSFVDSIKLKVVQSPAWRRYRAFLSVVDHPAWPQGSTTTAAYDDCYEVAASPTDELRWMKTVIARGPSEFSWAMFRSGIDNSPYLSYVFITQEISDSIDDNRVHKVLQLLKRVPPNQLSMTFTVDFVLKPLRQHFLALVDYCKFRELWKAFYYEHSDSPDQLSNRWKKSFFDEVHKQIWAHIIMSPDPCICKVFLPTAVAPTEAMTFSDVLGHEVAHADDPNLLKSLNISVSPAYVHSPTATAAFRSLAVDRLVLWVQSIAGRTELIAADASIFVHLLVAITNSPIVRAVLWLVLPSNDSSCHNVTGFEGLQYTERFINSSGRAPADSAVLSEFFLFIERNKRNYYFLYFLQLLQHPGIQDSVNNGILQFSEPNWDEESNWLKGCSSIPKLDFDHTDFILLIKDPAYLLFRYLKIFFSQMGNNEKVSRVVAIIEGMTPGSSGRIFEARANYPSCLHHPHDQAMIPDTDAHFMNMLKYCLFFQLWSIVMSKIEAAPSFRDAAMYATWLLVTRNAHSPLSKLLLHLEVNEQDNQSTILTYLKVVQRHAIYTIRNVKKLTLPHLSYFVLSLQDDSGIVTDEELQSHHLLMNRILKWTRCLLVEKAEDAPLFADIFAAATSDVAMRAILTTFVAAPSTVRAFMRSNKYEALVYESRDDGSAPSAALLLDAAQQFIRLLARTLRSEGWRQFRCFMDVLEHPVEHAGMREEMEPSWIAEAAWIQKRLQMVPATVDWHEWEFVLHDSPYISEICNRIQERYIFYDNDHVNPSAVQAMGLRNPRNDSICLNLTDEEFTDLLTVAMYLHDTQNLSSRLEGVVRSMITDQEKRDIIAKFMKWVIDIYITPDITENNNQQPPFETNRTKWSNCAKFRNVSFEDIMECAVEAAISSHMLRSAARSKSHDLLEQLFLHYIRSSDPSKWKDLFRGSKDIAYFIKYVDAEDLDLAFTKFLERNPENYYFRQHLLRVRKLLKEPIVSAQALIELTSSSDSDSATTFFEALTEKAKGLPRDQVELRIAMLLTASWMKISKEKVLFPLPPRNAQIITLLTVASWAKSLLLGAEKNKQMGKALIAQVGTGEGKSLIIAMMAIFFVKTMKRRVHILENNPGLLEKDVETMKPLYAEFGIKTHQEDSSKPTLSWASTELRDNKDGRDGFARVGVTYCLRRNMERYYQDSILADIPGNPLANTVLIVDEVDDLIVDDAPNQLFASKDSQGATFQSACDYLKTNNGEIPERANGNFVWEVAERAYRRAQSMELNRDYAVKEGKYVILRDGKPVELYDYALEYLKYSLHNKPPVFRSIFYCQSIPYLLSQYECITGFSGSVGSPSEGNFLKEQFKAWCFDSPSFLDTCPNVSKSPPTMMSDAVVSNNKPCVHVYRTADHQTAKVIELCLRLHSKVPVLVIAKSTEEAIDLRDKLRASMRQSTPSETEIDCIQLFLQYKVGTMTLDKENWGKMVRRATTRHSERGAFYITVTDPFGGRGHDFDVHDFIVNRLGGLAVIMTSIPASEREWIQWKGRTARKDNAGQYAVVLCSEGEDFPMSGSLEMLKDYAMVDEFDRAIPNIYNELLIGKLLAMRDEGQQSKLDAIGKDILTGRRLNRLCDQFYREYGPMEEQSWPRNQSEVILRNLLCTPEIVPREIDKAFEDFDLLESDATVNDFEVPNVSDRLFWNEDDEAEWTQCFEGYRDNSQHVPIANHNHNTVASIAQNFESRIAPMKNPLYMSARHHHHQQQPPSRASDKAVLEAGPSPRPPQPRQRQGGNYHNTPLPPLPRSELSIAPPLPLVMEEPTCQEPQSQSYQINHSVEVSHKSALAAESQPKYSAPPPPPSRTQQQTHSVAPPPPPPGVADNAVLTMDSSIHKRSRRQSGGNPRSSISSKSYDLLECDESADSAPLMSRRTERKIAEAKVEANNKPSLPEYDDLMLSGIDGPELNQTVAAAPRGRRNPGMRAADLIITNSQAKADSKSSGGSAKQAAADSSKSSQGSETSKVATNHSSHVESSSNEKVAANNSSGITISTEKAAANLLRAKDTLLDHDRLTEICVDETKKVTNSLNYDLKMKLFDVAEGNNGLVVGVFDITGPNAGRGVPNLEVFGAITKTASKYTLILSAKVAQEIDQFRLSLYGRKRFEAKWNDVVVLFEEVTVKPPPKLRPSASFIFHNAKNAQQITSQGQLTISSRDDPRSGPGSPVFPDIYLPYDGRTAVQLPRGLPDAMITITPDIRGFSNKRSEKFLLLNGEVNPTELKIIVSATDLSGSEWRVVLTWGEAPRDLDLYCVTNFEPSEIYWMHKNEGGRSNRSKGKIELDVDKREGFGPETITFTPLADNKYRFYVHNFSNERALSESCANIVIHKGDGETLSFNVPTDIVVDSAGKHARYWNVFDVLDGELIIANEVVAEKLSGDAWPQDTVTFDSVPLEKLTLDEVLTLLYNCEYLSLVDPFQKDEIQGYTLNAVASIDELIEIDGSMIKRIVAKAFFKQLGEWKTDGVPKAKLVAPEMFIKDTVASDPLPLKELSIEGVSALLSNCGYSSFVVPFNSHLVHGRILDVMDSIRELMELDGSIKSAKARAFLMQLEKWKTDGVPREKLEAREIIVKINSPKLPPSHQYPDFLSPDKGSIYQDYKRFKDSGQSDVWKAVRVSDNMTVALKKFRGDMAKHILSNELKALWERAEKHPNVIEVLDFYWQPYPCLVMKFIDGPTLSDHLKDCGALNEATATEILRGIGEGLKYLHNSHVVHRDLKPDNIILEGREFKPVLIDLGLGKIAETTSMMQGSTVHRQGTYHWMAPEMLDPNEDDGKYHWSKKTDVYALGIIMWQLFTGKLPYAEITVPQKLIKRVIAGIRPPLSEVETGSSQLIRLMQKCWDADPNRRPSVEEFLIQLLPGRNDQSRSTTDGFAQGSTDLGGTDGMSATGITQQDYGVNTIKEEYSANLISNSNATVNIDSRSLNSGNQRYQGGLDTKNTEGKAKRDEVTVTYESDYKNIQEKTTESIPSWVSLVFTAPSTSSTSDGSHYVIIEDAILPRSNKRIAVLKARKSTRWIRVEYDDHQLGHIMSANFIFISLANKNDAAFVKEAVARLHEKIQELLCTTSIGRKEQEVWIETCSVFDELCALHFSPTIALYDAVIQAAEERSLKPFPSYLMLGLSKCSRIDSTMWNHDSLIGPYGIGSSSTFSHNTTSRVKVGVIDTGFSEVVEVDGSYSHDSLRERVAKVYYVEHVRHDDDRNHGNHVAGLIGATESSSIRMKGVCSNVELLLYAMPCGNNQIPRIEFQQDSNNSISWELLDFVNTWIKFPHISHLINCLSQMIRDSVRVVNISLEWWMGGHAYIENMLNGFQKVLLQQDWYFLVAAGNGSANLDSYTSLVDGNFNFFSALASLVPDRLTMVGASDVFGHNCSFSNHGTVVALSAPGEHILSTFSPPNNYDFMTGTSQSSPLMAGAVAVMILMFPELKYHQVVRRLKGTVDIHFSWEGKSNSAGRLNLKRAIETSFFQSNTFLESFRGLDNDVLERIRNIDRTMKFVSEEERLLAYPLRDKAFAAFDPDIFSIFICLTSEIVLDWYDRFSGKLAINAISSMHWLQAIESMKRACGRIPPDQASFCHEARGVLIEQVKLIFMRQQEQFLKQEKHLQKPTELISQSMALHQIRQSVAKLQHLTEELSQRSQHLQVQLSELLNQPDWDAQAQAKPRRLLSHINQLKRRQKHLLSLIDELRERADQVTQRNQNLEQLAMRFQILAGQLPQQSTPLNEWLSQQVQDLNHQIKISVPSSDPILRGVHIQQDIQMAAGLPSLKVQIEQIEGLVLPVDTRERLANLRLDSLMRCSIIEEWESTLQMQLSPSPNTESFPTAFLRNIARLQEGRLLKRLQALQEDRSKFIEDAPSDLEDRRLLMESFLIDADDLAILSVDFVALLQRAKEESAIALGQLTPPDRFQSMRALWTNEQRWLEHIICVWEEAIADLKLYGAWFNVEMSNN